MTRRRFTATLALTPAALAAAETQQQRGKRFIDRCLQALGGDAFRRLSGYVQTGSAYSFYNDQISGLSPARIYTKYLEPGPAVREMQRQVLGKKDEETVLMSPTEGWDITFRGATPIAAEHLQRYRESLLTDTFYILRMRLDEPNVSFSSQGADVVENQPVEAVEFYDGDSRSVLMWIHSSTWLPVRQLVKRWDPQIKDRREEMTRYTKYGDAGNGVMLPHTIQRERDGEKSFQLFADSVKVGEFADSMFKLPAGAKILTPK